MKIPPSLHDVFGTEQRGVQLVVVLGVGTAITAALVVLGWETFGAMAPWRGVLAAVLIWDVACGCLANVTRSTNDYYAARPRNRVIFLAAHVHLLVIALLLGTDLVPAGVVWAATIAAAAVVNARAGSPDQVFLAVLLVVVVLVAVPFLFGDPLLIAVGSLFVLKVAFAFAVDHYPGRDRVGSMS